RSTVVFRTFDIVSILQTRDGAARFHDGGIIPYKDVDADGCPVHARARDDRTDAACSAAVSAPGGDARSVRACAAGTSAAATAAGCPARGGRSGTSSRRRGADRSDARRADLP